ncbi:unnamed protein product [Sphagnum jensenii]|uniref:Dof-type domain-containing protein n=1 Tax=Sphagnum jensenii TaxID=128206 RepID=A0ABP1AWR6_9BRYO
MSTHDSSAGFKLFGKTIAKNGIAMGGEEEDEQNLDELRSSSGSNSGVVDDDSTILAVLNNNKSTTTTMCGSGLLHGLQSGAEPCTDSAGLILDHQGDVCVSDSTGLILEDQGVVTQKTITTNIAVQEEEEEEAEEEEDDDKLVLCSSKPAEKIMACPRCDSLDTKFCYYNNYNINQPRHFCKNCQRYWTAGGTLRNVPVGAGRRKNKQNGGGIHGPPSLLQSSSEGETVMEPSAAAHAHAHAAHAHHRVCQDSSSVLLQQIELSDGTQEQTSSSHCCRSASPLKISQPKQQQHHHLGGLMQQLENSSSQLLLSPGGSTDSCITINNNHQSSPFSLSMSVGGGSAEAVASLHPFAAATSMMQSTDSPTRLGQKQIIKAPPPPPSSSSLAAAANASAAFGASWILSNENETGGYPSKDVDVRGNSNSTPTEPLPMQHTGTSFTGPLLPMHMSTSFKGPPPMHMVVKDGHVFQHLHSSAVYHHQQQQSMMLPTSMGDLGAAWTSNGTPFSFFNGTWPPPYGHNNSGWNNGGAAGPVPSSTTMFGSATTMATTAGTGSLGYYAPSAQKFAPWCPAPPGTTATTLQAAGGHAHWALAAAAAAAAAPGILGTHGASSGVVLSDMKGALDHHVSDDNAAAAAFKACAATTTSVSGTSAGVVPWSAQGWRLKTSSGPIGGGIGGGKRASPEGGKVEEMWGSSKLMRVVDYNNNNCNTWNNNTVGIKSNPDVINNNTGNLFKTFQPRMEIQAGAGAGSSKHFYNPTQMFVNSLQFQETTTT